MSNSNRSPGQLLNLRHIIGALLIALMTLGLAACSATKLVYQNAPELSYWWLDSYLDFNESQSLRLREDLAALQLWHRQYELPVYVRTLEDLQKMALLDTTPEQVCDLYFEFRARFQAILDQFEPRVTALAPTLKLGQIDHLERQLDKRSQKWRDEWLDVTPGQRQTRRVKLMVDRSEAFYGYLEEPQLAVLRAGLAAAPLDLTLTYRESQRRQQDILQTLRQLNPATQSATDIKLALRAMLARSMDSPDPVLRNHMRQMVQSNCRTLAALHNAITPAQRARFAETLKDYQTDARSLVLPGR